MNVNQAYTAGLFDGEGSICILKKHTKAEIQKNWSPRFTLSLDLAQVNDRGVLDVLCKKYGGHVYRHHYDKAKIRPYSHWRISTIEAIKFLEDIKDFLVIKKREAEIAIEFGHYYHIGQQRGIGRSNRVPQEEIKKRLYYYELLKSIHHEIDPTHIGED